MTTSAMRTLKTSIVPGPRGNRVAVRRPSASISSFDPSWRRCQRASAPPPLRATKRLSRPIPQELGRPLEEPS